MRTHSISCLFTLISCLFTYQTSGDPTDIHSTAFEAARLQVEDAVDAALVSEDGFMGCTVRRITAASNNGEVSF